MANLQFSDLGLDSWLIRQCISMGVKNPTPIQVNCIPQILSGMDCIGCAKTGSGKTLAFALPILQKLCEDPYGIFALVITPTRELAYQISEQFIVMGKMINLNVCVVTGGVEMIVQAQELSKKPHIVVATPGRLLDHIESCNTFSLSQIKFLVLDEADRLLGGRYDGQIGGILQTLPKDKQTLLFSATMTDSLDEIKQFTRNKVFTWQSEDLTATVDELKQYYILCPKEARDGYLVEVIRTFCAEDENASIMIFTDTCKNCQILSMTLTEIGLDNVALHGVNTQKARLASLASFKSNLVRILIATDVASRGLDIPAVSLVINHNVPNNPSDYIHRVGRTARAGREGTAISLVTQYDVNLVLAIEEQVKTKLKPYEIKGKEVAKILTQVKVTMREAEIKLDETDFDEKRLIHKRKKLVMHGLDPDEVEKEVKKMKKLKNLKKERRNKRKPKQKSEKIINDNNIELHESIDSKISE